MTIQNIMIIFFSSFLYFSAHGQEGYYVEKDYRIQKYQYSIVEYLIERKQFTSNNVLFSIRDYQGKMYVRKKLEIFDDKILVVQFGSLGDHSDRFWGILGENEKFFFIYGSKNKKLLFDFLNKYNRVTQYIVRDFIKRSVEKE